LEHVEAARSKFVNSFPKYGPKSLAIVAKTIAIFILDFLKGYDVAKQQAIMHKVVSHELLIDIMPPYLQDVERLNTTISCLKISSLDCQVM
jgi:hypothetical protein